MKTITGRDLPPKLLLVINRFRGRFSAHNVRTRPSRVAPMTCQQLAERIQQLQPEASTQDVARLCLLLTNSQQDLQQFTDARHLQSAWRQVGLQLQLATDQHAAMTSELEQLASSDPKEFSAEQIWVLIRAIKVQSQVLQMYVGHPVLDV